MEGNQKSILPITLTALLSIAALFVASDQSFAKDNKRANNSATQRSPAKPRRVRPRSSSRSKAKSPDNEYHLVDFCEPYEDADAYCDGGCVGCGDAVRCDTIDFSCRQKPVFNVGVEATFIKPRFENNPAFTVTDSDVANFDTINDTEFDYDLEFSPRVWFGTSSCNGIGWRVTWWHFDHEAATASANPPANGFGQITHPEFGAIDISTTIPTDTFSASTDLTAYVIDMEATHLTSFRSWQLGVGCGIRYAYAEQGYFAQLRDTNDIIRGQIDFRHSIEGFGPTISFEGFRPVSCHTGLFCKCRGSVLFGDGDSQLTSGEDLDLTTPFTTTRNASRDDLLSIGEIQVGIRWKGTSDCRRIWVPFVSLAMEGQIWNGAGNATSEDGTLGFFGVSTGAGIDW